MLMKATLYHRQYYTGKSSSSLQFSNMSIGCCCSVTHKSTMYLMKATNNLSIANFHKTHIITDSTTLARDLHHYNFET